MKVRLGLFREYMQELTLAELSVDRNFINSLKKARADAAGEVDVTRNYNPQSVALEWIADIEEDTQKKLYHGTRAQVVRFVVQRLPALVKRFNGNVPAAEQTMYNLLNARFNTVRTGT